MSSDWQSDIKELKQDVKELLKSSAIHNQILSEHEKRSRHLEERFQPIEQIYIFAAKSTVVISIIAGIAGIIKVGKDVLK